MGRLLLLFVGVPALELWLLIEVGRRIGAVETVGLIVLTGFVGAALARSQGLQVLATVQREVAEGRLPGAALLEGLMILLASALLVTPGILTDVVGFLCLVPACRAAMRRLLVRRLEAAIERGSVEVHSVHFDAAELGGRRIIDVTPPPAERDEPDERRGPR